MRRLLTTAAFLALAFVAYDRHAARLAHASPAAIARLAAAGNPLEPGSFPDQWIHGADCDGDPEIQVHAYNQNLYILRQSKCETFEAPFMYLIFGQERVLLLDTGATPDSNLAARVTNLIRRWQQQTGNFDVKLVVAHTHTHPDHVQGDGQFVDNPLLEVPVGWDLLPNKFEQFWGFQDYPNDIPTIDLGGRVIDLIGVPGHDPRNVAFYDRNTQLLLTSDIVYPGHLFIFSQTLVQPFKDSLQRLIDFAAANPVQWVVGCHVEYSTTPGQPYAYGTQVQPNEHPLQFSPTILPQVLQAAESLGDDPDCTIFPEFVIHPVYKCGITWNG